ncbi:hypothetical protein [Synechococcus phage DSL-LC02]|nr:hypothetical protein [Synechococcus phage DSL-LC02]
MSEIRDLVESYYNDVYIEEEQLDEAGMDMFATPAMKSQQTSSAVNFYTNKKPTKPVQQDYLKPARTAASNKAAETVFKLKPGSLSSRPASPAPAPAARPLPAGAPKLGLKVTSPGAAKVAPSAAPAAKPAGSAMDQWAAANPKLAAAKAERDRTRGTSATTNPQMADLKSRLPAPTSPSPTTAKK